MTTLKAPLLNRWSLSNTFKYSTPPEEKPRGVAIPKVKNKNPLILFNNKELLSLNENDYDITFSSDLEECLSKVIPINSYSNKVDTHSIYYQNNILELSPKKVPILREELASVKEYIELAKQYKKIKYNNSYRLESKALKEKVKTITSQRLALGEDVVYDFRSKLLRVDTKTTKLIKKELKESKEAKKWYGKNIVTTALSKHKYSTIYIFKRPFYINTISPHIRPENYKATTVFKLALESKRTKKKVVPEARKFLEEIESLLESTKNYKGKVLNRQKRERQYLETLARYIRTKINEQ